MKQDPEFISKVQCNSMLNSIGDALYVIGGKWKLRIIVALMDGNKRFNELQRSIEGISAKVLSATLKELELNGFVSRQVFTGSPVVVEYHISDYAKTLHGVLQSLSEWGEVHKEKIKETMRQESVDSGSSSVKM